MSARIYQSAVKAAEAAGISREDLERLVEKGAIAQSGKGVSGSDVEEYLAAGPDDDHKPPQQDLIRAGLLEGLTNEEIRDRVLEVYPDSAIKPAHVSWTLGNERRNSSAWWQKHRQRIGTLRPGTKGTA